MTAEEAENNLDEIESMIISEGSVISEMVNEGLLNSGDSALSQRSK